MLPRSSVPMIVTAVVALAASAAPPAAHADSISYIKAGDVWLSEPDGSRQVQLTKSGGYSDASQADDGTIIALAGVRLHRLDRSGKVLADFDTPVSDTRPPGQRVFYGPYEPALSPDGTKVAYTYFHTTISQQPGCFPPACVTVDHNQGIGYSHADRQTGWDEPGLGRQSGWRHPAWMSNTQVMLSAPARALNYDVITDTVGDGNGTILQWFTETAVSKMGEGDVTRQGTKLAFVTGQGDEKLRVFRMNGAAPALPEACYEHKDAPGGRFSSPSWSPDGARLTWAAADGVYAAAVPDFAGGCTLAGAENGRLIVPGASSPDWGPAAVPAAAAPAPPATPPVTSKPGGPGAGQPAAGAQPAGRVSLKVSATTLRKALAKGLLVRVAGAGQNVTLVARRGARTVASGKATASDGAAIVRLRFTAAARRSLRGARLVRLTISGAGAATTVTLRR